MYFLLLNVNCMQTESGDTQISTLFACVGVKGQPSGSGQGQSSYNVTIEANPDMPTYTVGDSVMFMCMVYPPITSTTVNVSYLWLCDDCFADGRTGMVIVQQLTDMNTSMIDCEVTVDNDTFTTDTSFDLQVTQGMIIHNACIRYIHNMNLLVSGPRSN